MVDALYIAKTQSANPYHNIALEEALLLNAPKNAITLYLWQNERTVVIGRNQCAWQEVDISKLNEDGGRLARRLSGGGAVYHDMGNLNFTFLARADAFDVARQTRVIANAVRSFSLPVEISGRNDLTTDGKKFSGNAYYKSGDNHYHHGTLLLGTDVAALSKYLTVSPLKLSSKGVQSVRARVANLHIPCAQMADALIAAAQEEYGVLAQTAPGIAPAQARVNFFSSWDFVMGKQLPNAYRMEGRMSFGLMTIELALSHGAVQDCAVYSDAMDEAFILQIAPLLRGQNVRMLSDALDPLKSAHPKEIEEIRTLLKQHGF